MPPTPAQLAERGDLAALTTNGANDRTTLKWLLAARDFGHAIAEDYIGDLLEVSSLRHDDSGYEQAAAHWELAVAYLEGGDGLALDLALAKQHLIEAFKVGDLDAINQGAGEHYDAEALRSRLTGEARTLLERGLANRLHDRYARAIERIELVRHMRACQAPTILVDAELAQLQREIAALADPDDPRDR